MAQDAQGFVKAGLDETDALVSSRVKAALVADGTPEDVAQEIGKNLRVAGTSTADDAKAVGAGLSKFPKKVLEELQGRHPDRVLPRPGDRGDARAEGRAAARLAGGQHLGQRARRLQRLGEEGGGGHDGEGRQAPCARAGRRPDSARHARPHRPRGRPRVRRGRRQQEEHERRVPGRPRGGHHHRQPRRHVGPAGQLLPDHGRGRHQRRRLDLGASPRASRCTPAATAGGRSWRRSGVQTRGACEAPASLPSPQRNP